MRPLGYRPSLDGIRGIAIALVVGQHFLAIPPGGLVGVDLFFVLSGFLITTLLLEERIETGHIRFRAFYERRARRLFPALFTMLAAYLIVQGAQGKDAIRTVAMGGLYFGNVVQAWNLAPVRHSALLQLWSLAEEEQFYLLWPLLLLILWRTRRPVIWLAGLAAALLTYKIALAVIAHPEWPRMYYGPDTHADGLVLGALLAAMRATIPFEPPEWFGMAGASALASGAILGQLSTSWVAFELPLFEVGLCLMVAAAVSDTELARALAQRPLVGLGKISYSVYLWHAPIWFGLAAVLPAGNRLELGALAIVATLLVSVASYRYIERPFRRRRKGQPQPVAAEGGVV